MPSLNKVFLIGNLTRDPEVRYLPSGQAVADLGMAINRRYRTANGEDKEEVVFVSVVVWQKQAEACGKYLSRGLPLFVEGHLQLDEWEKDGKKNSRIRVVAERVQFLSGPKRDAEYAAPAEGGAGSHAPERVVRPAAPQERPGPLPAGGEESPPPSSGGDDDNLPF